DLMGFRRAKDLLEKRFGEKKPRDRKPPCRKPQPSSTKPASYRCTLAAMRSITSLAVSMNARTKWQS
ncbi:MAG: hypothetical protein ABR579_07235, partial [Actinomycetota bacterium]